MTKLLLGICTLSLGHGVIVFAVSTTIRCYMPCPFWDQEAVVDAIAKGAARLELFERGR
jgi:hypothetical protein